MQALADKLGVTYTTDGDDADTAETLTTKILAVTPTDSQLNGCTVDNLKVLAELLELEYTYTNKADLIALIKAEYTE
ncbi:MAG: hypothetical protein J5588_06220 [Bacteroidales bacterium]|nr:hypothetical protein [Bacteroidales bacterium]